MEDPSAIGILIAKRHEALYDKKEVKPLSERAELVRYFYEKARSQWAGKAPLTAKQVAIRLAHLSMQDLYAFKSMCEDRERGGYPWSKFFWGSLKAGKRAWE